MIGGAITITVVHTVHSATCRRVSTPNAVSSTTLKRPGSIYQPPDNGGNGSNGRTLSRFAPECRGRVVAAIRLTHGSTVR